MRISSKSFPLKKWCLTNLASWLSYLFAFKLWWNCLSLGHNPLVLSPSPHVATSWPRRSELYGANRTLKTQRVIDLKTLWCLCARGIILTSIGEVNSEQLWNYETGVRDNTILACPLWGECVVGIFVWKKRWRWRSHVGSFYKTSV